MFEFAYYRYAGSSSVVIVVVVVIASILIVGILDLQICEINSSQIMQSPEAINLIDKERERALAIGTLLRESDQVSNSGRL